MATFKAARAVGESAPEIAARVDVRAGQPAEVAGIARAKYFQKRSVFVKVLPAPINFAERRSILRVLEKHGQVEYFRHLPTQPGVFISLMKEKEVAQKLVNSSPIQSAIPASDSEPSHPTRMDRTTAQINKHMANTREFTITAEAAPKYKHQNARSNIARVWPNFIKTGNEFPSETLRQSLPSSIAAEGLRYWGLDFAKQATKNSKYTERVTALGWIPSRFKQPDGEPTQLEEEPALAEGGRPSKIAEEPAEELSQAKEEIIQFVDTKLTKESTQATEEPTQVAESADIAQRPQVSTEQPAETSSTRPSS
ncbi:hypothetical protein NW762_004922 [Fusarium torreyae]|uniref:Uncharacterized protein n=1 Tax=Fusarium torreyae TaxID=1237075 RepID=A0A9W8S7G7_9HYPO|nr:hypothetical protein NW762_004922 [Fusarium torreyae]